MDENTAFAVIDFEYCNEVLIKKISRIHDKLVWQGWYGNACLLCHYEGNPNKIHYKKRTYLTFIGKAKQVQGTVMAICQSVLKQIKEDFPHLESIIDKSDNAGCYHNEVLFALKFHWPRSNLNLKFLKLSSVKGSQVKTNATVTVPPPNVKCSILLTVTTTLTALIRCLKQCGQQQPYVVLQQMY